MLSDELKPPASQRQRSIPVIGLFVGTSVFLASYSGYIGVYFGDLLSQPAQLLLPDRALHDARSDGFLVMDGAYWPYSQGSKPHERATGYEAIVDLPRSAPDEEEAKAMVSILTFSNGQEYCYNNLILNVLYQDYQHSLLELILFETSDAPSALWSARADGGGDLLEWAVLRGASYRLPRIIYRWFDKTAPDMTRKNPSLGKLRNKAMDLAKGEYLVNFDNDDFYHPNYLRYVIGHMRAGGLQVVLLGPHSGVDIRPDGTIELAAVNRLPRVGGHMLSITKEVSKRCRYQDTSYGEENVFFHCTQKLFHGQWARLNLTNGSLGNRYLMVKFDNPLSITRQRFFVEREKYNRLHLEDFRAIRLQHMFYYRSLHELTRPVGVPDASMTSIGFWENGPHESWEAFHKRHKDLWSRTAYPFCKGFARLPGEIFTMDEKGVHFAAGPRVKTVAPNAMTCCTKCKALGPAPLDSPTSGCNGWTFELENNSCILGGRGIRLAPELVFTHEAAVRISACPRCGKGLDAHDSTS